MRVVAIVEHPMAVDPDADGASALRRTAVPENQAPLGIDA
jgi:hypothetical protein